MDDIQFTQRKTQTQELLSILSTTFSRNRQIVVTCDRHSKEVESLNVRLRSAWKGSGGGYFRRTIKHVGYTRSQIFVAAG
jgi:hypothetical protein